MTAPNPEGVQRCIRAALADAGIGAERRRRDQRPPDRDQADPREVRAWAAALGRTPGDVAADHLDQVADRPRARRGGRHRVGRVGADAAAAASCTRRSTARTCTRRSRRSRHRSRTRRRDVPGLRVLAKASFGFGDVNGCLVFRSWNDVTSGRTNGRTRTWTEQRSVRDGGEDHHAVREEPGGAGAGQRPTPTSSTISTSTRRAWSTSCSPSRTSSRSRSPTTTSTQVNTVGDAFA